MKTGEKFDVSNTFLVGSEIPLMHYIGLVVASIDVHKLCFHVSQKFSEQKHDPEQQICPALSAHWTVMAVCHNEMMQTVDSMRILLEASFKPYNWSLRKHVHFIV